MLRDLCLASKSLSVYKINIALIAELIMARLSIPIVGNQWYGGRANTVRLRNLLVRQAGEAKGRREAGRELLG